MDKQDSRIESMEKRITQKIRGTCTPSSACSSSAESSSKKVPAIVRVSYNRVHLFIRLILCFLYSPSSYRILIDEDSDFRGYNTDLG